MPSTTRSFRSRLSVYRHVIRAARDHGVAVRGSADLPPANGAGTPEASEFHARVDSMRVWCRVAERIVVANELRDAVVHAGFERLSRVRPVLRRYRSIGTVAGSVDVYGEPDDALSVPSLREVPFVGGPLANEWFLLIESAKFRTVLAGEDLDGIGGGRPVANRRFHAVACHHPAVVADVKAAIEEERDRLLAAAGERGVSVHLVG